MAVLFGNAAWVAGTPPPLMPEDVHIEVPADSLFGSLPLNRGLTVTIHIPKQSFRQGEPVVVLESPGFASHTIPMEMDQERHRHSATVNLGRLSTTMGTPPKATPIQIEIARQRGLHLEPLVRRTLVVTIAIPESANRQTAPADLSANLTDLAPRTESNPPEPALLESRVHEEELLVERRVSGQEGYWKILQQLIHRQMKNEAPISHRREGQRAPGIGFRLYANGEAQLVEVERSSGDKALDQAALLAVINAHPFPRFPSGTRDSHIAVHVDVPTPVR